MATLGQIIGESEAERVGIGFPGEYREGRVVEPGNLARPGGVGTEVDPAIAEWWRGYPLQEVLRASSHRDVRVVNDATLAALGAAEGRGRELVVTLGTGCGIALVVEGRPEPIRDVGAAPFEDGLTYDQALGEQGRVPDESLWRDRLMRALRGFVCEFAAETLHVGGGNARLIDDRELAGLAPRVVRHSNDVALRGAAQLFR